MVVIDQETHKSICGFITNFNGLSIDCERKLKAKFLNVNPNTVSAIHAKEWQKRSKKNHENMRRQGKMFLKEYYNEASHVYDHTILLRIAVRERHSPVSLCRILLHEAYPNQPKSSISVMLKQPHQIPDPILASNVNYCIFNDNSDGPLTDVARQIIGEDYEQRLKKMASDAGMHFHDEVYLRRYGYDKTPDLKLAVPCLFKGKVIYWIESKASFGDMESHQRYITTQLSSYGNRFGAGIVIYWLGYLDKIADCLENDDFIVVTDKFPEKDEFTFLELPTTIN